MGPRRPVPVSGDRHGRACWARMRVVGASLSGRCASAFGSCGSPTGSSSSNGRRILLRSSHTGNHVPVGQIVPPTRDMLRTDLIYAKASGFNMLRFMSGVAWPEQLDLADELGLMIYEEPMGAWLLQDSPEMVERYDASLREMILRDRNHPCCDHLGTPDRDAGRAPVPPRRRQPGNGPRARSDPPGHPQ